MAIDRREFMKSLTASLTVPAATSVFPALTNSANAESFEAREGHRPPNVILMICDDLGYGDLGSYGGSLPTPHIDAMATEGARFLRFNAGHPICSASRAALLTGRYGLRSSTTGAFGPSSKTGTSLDETLLSNLFQMHGYRTKAIGKWHLGDAPEYLPTSRGFDSYYGVPYSDDMRPLPLIRDKSILEADTNRDLLTPRYTEEAVKYIEEQSGNHPFFLYLAFSYPHDPARASARFRGKTGFGDVGDSIAEIDWSVGEVLATLKQRGLDSNTMVCFTSDHGPWYQGSPGLLRGRKASTFEGGFRVPFIARWPGVVPERKVVNAWCSNLDVLPTLAGLCDLHLPEKPLDGVDFWPVISRNESTVQRKPILYFSPMGDRGMDVHCIRKQEWKLRVAQATGGEIYTNDRTTAAKRSAWLQHPELYNIERDPSESYDVAKYHPEIVAELLTELDTQIQSFPMEITEAHARLKQNKGDISTPPGASPRPPGQLQPSWSWEPEERR